jgi:hypothetical protein
MGSCEAETTGTARDESNLACKRAHEANSFLCNTLRNYGSHQ